MATRPRPAKPPQPRPLNRSLHAAKSAKQDEFYTQLSDIEKELRHYTKHFKNKTILCNCDDPKVSHFQRVIEWVKQVFADYRREMKNVAWGPLYNGYQDKKLDAKKLGREVDKLMEDEEVGKKSGIYPYLLTRDERWLNLRAFSDKEKRQAYERQKGVCVKCRKKFEIQEMEADHVKPWHEGGKTNAANCQMLCREDNRRKGGR